MFYKSAYDPFTSMNQFTEVNWKSYNEEYLITFMIRSASWKLATFTSATKSVSRQGHLWHKRRSLIKDTSYTHVGLSARTPLTQERAA